MPTPDEDDRRETGPLGSEVTPAGDDAGPVYPPEDTEPDRRR